MNWKNYMRKNISRLLILVVVLTMALPSRAFAGNVDTTALPIMGKDEECNILVIGNSFGRDTQEYMGKVAEAAGYSRVAVGLMEIKGVNLYAMWENVENGKKKFSYRVMTNSKTPKFHKATARKIFTDRLWDIVILQPQSHSHAKGVDFFFTSAEKNTAKEVYLSDLLMNKKEADEEQDIIELVTTVGTAEEPEAADVAEDITEDETAERASAEDVTSEPETEETAVEDLSESVTDEIVELSSADIIEVEESTQELAEMDEISDNVRGESTLADETEPADVSEELNPVKATNRKVCILDIWADYIHCYNKKAKVGLEMTWAYPKDSTVPQFPKFGSDQVKMYEKVSKVTKQLMEKSHMDFVVPVGTAVQNARNSYIGDHLHRDRRHLSQTSGRVLAAMSAARSCGIDLSGITDIKNTLEPFCTLNLPMLLQSVRSSVKKPYKVTKQTMEKPKLKKPVLVVQANANDNSIAWKKVEGATRYVLLRKKGNEEYTVLANLKKEKIGYKDTSVKAGATYTYRLVAKGDDVIASVNSEAVSVSRKKSR